MNSFRHILRAAGVCLCMLPGLVSCVMNTRYCESAQVNTGGWDLGDTLFFPVEVVESPTYTRTVAAHTPYSLKLGVRHTNEFPYTSLRLQFAVEYLDSLGRPVATLLNQDVVAPLTDEHFRWDGRSWGSFYEKEFLVSRLTLSFPKAGLYRMRLLPVGNQTPLPGLESLTLTVPE